MKNITSCNTSFKHYEYTLTFYNIQHFHTTCHRDNSDRSDALIEALKYKQKHRGEKKGQGKEGEGKKE